MLNSQSNLIYNCIYVILCLIIMLWIFVLGVMDEDQGLNDGKQTEESLEETRNVEHQPLLYVSVAI